MPLRCRDRRIAPQRLAENASGPVEVHTLHGLHGLRPSGSPSVQQDRSPVASSSLPARPLPDTHSAYSPTVAGRATPAPNSVASMAVPPPSTWLLGRPPSIRE